MNFTFSEALKLTLLLVLTFSVVGCAQNQSGPEAASWGRVPVGGVTENSNRFWYAACFRMPWDGKGRPNWAMDALLASEVVLPVLQGASGDMPLWRFHRRAGRDATGHQFTFLMYATPEVAEEALVAMEQSSVVHSLLREGSLKSVVRTCRGDLPKAALNAHSDPGWHPHIQQSWPYFIMGVSAHWLALVDSVSKELGRPMEASIASLLGHYGEVHQEVSQLWQGQGQHAYVHHLSAIFAYEPLFIQRFIGF